jgi:hypothetical protein
LSSKLRSSDRAQFVEFGVVARRDHAALANQVRR